MSGLAGLLAGHRPPGVYRWHAAFDAADVRHAVEHAGWRLARLDGVGVEDKAALMDALAVTLDLPDHFGRNLDALWDVLRDLDRPLVLLWEEWGPLARADRDTFAGVTALLAERAEQGGLVVLLRGPGPDVDLPSLD